MAQWFALKATQPDALLFFRMGDFYELFFTDAEAAASALDIALTARGEHAGAPIAMCGVPVHAAEAYLARLIRRGFRVAVAEQMEDPKTRAGKAPIRREVVRLITPGTLTEDSLLDAARPNLLLALAVARAGVGAAWLDISTGLFETAALAAGDLPALLGRLDPAEILAGTGLELGEWEGRRGPESLPPPPEAARRRLAEAFAAASVDAFGSFTDVEAQAAAAALDYVRTTSAGALPHLGRPVPRGAEGVLAMDPATRASLELLRTRDGRMPHSLFAAIDRSVTAPGARLLGGWIAAPLTDAEAIAGRQDAWSWMGANPAATTRLRAALRAAPDMARALGRLSVQRGGPRDLAALRAGLAAARGAAEALAGPLPGLLATARAALTPDPALEATLAAALTEPAPLRLDDGAAICPGFDPELDAERGLRDDSRKVLARLQLDYAQRFGAASLKIRHHAQLGYVIEVPAAAAERLRAEPALTLRQSMANAARFSTAELADLDRRIAEAAERSAARERTVFAHLVRLALDQAAAIAAAADALALLDVAQSAAALAQGGRWCRPVLTAEADFIARGARHSVVEAALAGSATAFVPNDCDLSPDRRLLLLTGPNMAGKSTFLRQNALLVVLAQAGLPVPAESLRLGIVDRLFSRVGAADDLARGRSTFMVEMTETAAILHQAGPRSLVVVDEIGRGTATLDGLAIAWAVLEALHGAIRCRTIFATHFHELAALAERLPRLRPHTMRVKEWKRTVVFLHEVAEGAAGRSWGVHVAELAGVPTPVVRRAAALLAALEAEAGPLRAGAALGALPLFAAVGSPTPSAPPDTTNGRLLAELAGLDPDRLSPREALDALYRLKSLLPACAGGDAE
ncbi:MAG: DNA mismatch repair protein MutS [Rhodospirillales bacterium]|jgi:DNA mismatch repair protein MutS|nr:DNA mismatch repair protein MutS [Rhodospirillales bacterium]